jgi:hypothetical protein
MKRRPLPPAETTASRHAARPTQLRQHEDETDIAVSERLIQKETPVPLAKVLKEFGRVGDRSVDR